jgi:hypothetical protein
MCTRLRLKPKKLLFVLLIFVIGLVSVFEFYKSRYIIDGCYELTGLDTSGTGFLRAYKGGIYWYDGDDIPPFYLGYYYYRAFDGWVVKSNNSEEQRVLPLLIEIRFLSPNRSAKSWPRKLDWKYTQTLIEKKKERFGFY